MCFDCTSTCRPTLKERKWCTHLSVRAQVNSTRGKKACSNGGAPGVSNPGISAIQLFSKYKVVEQKPSQLWEKCIAQIAKIPLFVFF